MTANFILKNIFSKIPTAKDAEVFETLAQAKAFRVERITSHGQATPIGEWLTQAHDEWVMVLKGEGRLKFKGRPRLSVLKAGDHIFIPAGTLHRVEWTSPRASTVWLAVSAA